MSSKKRRKLNVKKLLVFLLALYLLGYGGYYLYTEPIRNIVITGNSLVNDIDIIKAAGLKKYPSIFSVKSKKLKAKIKELPLIEDVTIKKDLKFRLKITVKEAKVLFINSANNKIMLSDGRQLDNNYQYGSIPTLINYTPEDILKEFTKKFSVVDYGIISLISEIKYAPSIGEDGTPIDETRFIFYMNDGNQVYTNIDKCGGITLYREFFASIGKRKGIWYLDSNYNSSLFKDY